MIKQNIEVAVSAKQKIELHRSTDLDSLKIFEELTLEEMKELLLYCVYPSESKGEYEPLPSKKLFPHQLAFYHSHPRETMGYQYDTLDHLRYCVQLGTDDLREKIVKSSRDLLKDVVGNQAEKLGITNKVLNNLINQVHYMFGSVLLDAQSLGLCLKREDIVMDVGLTALSYLRTAPRSLSEPPDDGLVDFAKKGELNAVISVIGILSMRKSYKKAFQCLTYATGWLKEERISLEEFRVAPPLVNCVAHLRGNTIITDIKEGSQCPVGKKAIDWLIDVINQCHPKVQIGFARIVKKYVLDPRLPDKEMIRWIKGENIYRSAVGPNCLLDCDEDSEKLHIAMDAILSNKKTAK